MNNHPLQKKLLTIYQQETAPCYEFSDDEVIAIKPTDLHVGKNTDSFQNVLHRLIEKAKSSTTEQSESVTFSRLTRARLVHSLGFFLVAVRRDAYG